MRPLGTKTRPTHQASCKRKKNISRWTNITLDVEGDTGESACELLHEKIRDCRRWEECLHVGVFVSSIWSVSSRSVAHVDGM